MDSKKPWLSKTLWLNAIGAALAIAYPPAALWMSENPEVVAGVWAGLNVLLRLVTKDKVSLV